MPFVGYVTSQGDATVELLDTNQAETLSSAYQIPFPPTFVFTKLTHDADGVCIDAGLAVNFAGLLDAAKAVGSWPPGVQMPMTGALNRHYPDYWLDRRNDRIHLLIRAWAKKNAPSLIDAAAKPRKFMAYSWW